MVNETIDRLTPIIPGENIFVVTNASQVAKMREVTGGRILQKHVLSEPSPRNTAACIGYSAVKILKVYGDGVMVVCPSDTYVKDGKSISERTFKKGETFFGIAQSYKFESTGKFTVIAVTL